MRCFWLVGGLLLWTQVGLAQNRRGEAEGKVAKAASQKKADGKSGAEKVDLLWVALPEGSFLMGSPGEVGEPDEHPQRQVTVKAFSLSKSEVTVGQYGACVRAGACTAPNAGGFCNWGVVARENHPINCVDWDQARAFAAWVGGRLPTEAEWEYAARSGGGNQGYPWGDEEATCHRTVMQGEGRDGCGRDSTWPVCSKPAGNSAQGVCDLAGNVWEWVEDTKCDYPQAPTDGSAASCSAVDRGNRGGGWGSPAATYLRASFRLGAARDFRSYDLGFRVAR